ncbi:hypothetical protein Ptc2401_01318 [Prosthecochloris sp. CIB 2401]|nr:hypothetical protein Ptc2401_01318 [Prosthecochloris sp. CIB 2401]
MATVGFADAVADVAGVVEAGYGVAEAEGDDADGKACLWDFNEPGVAGDVLFCWVGGEKADVSDGGHRVMEGGCALVPDRLICYIFHYGYNTFALCVAWFVWLCMR